MLQIAGFNVNLLALSSQSLAIEQYNMGTGRFNMFDVYNK